MPASLRNLFAARPGAPPEHLVLLFPSVSTSDAGTVRRLAAQTSEVRLSSGAIVVGAGEPMVLADILETVERDAPRIVALTACLVFLVLYASLGKLALALGALAPAVITVAVTLGLMPRLGLRLDYLNMIMIPILIGIGVDDGAHLIMRVDAGERLVDVWRHTGWDITGAILTDIFGFGVLALAAHRGLQGLGKMSLLGLSLSLVVCVVLLPATMATIQRLGAHIRRARAG